MTDEQLKQDIGRNIAVYRKARGYSAVDFGIRMGEETGIVWKRQTVSAAELGNRAFTITDLAALARVLEVTLPDLINKEYFPPVLRPFDDSALIKSKIADAISELSRILAQA